MRRWASRRAPSATTTSSRDSTMISEPMAITSGNRAGVRLDEYSTTGYVGDPGGARNEAMANSSNEMVNAIRKLENSAGPSSGRVTNQNARRSEAPRSHAASPIDGSSVRRRGRMTSTLYGSEITMWPASTATREVAIPNWCNNTTSPTASTMYGTTSGMRISTTTSRRSASLRRARLTAAMTPSNVAASPLTAAISTLRPRAEVRSVSENAALNQRVEKLLIGSEGMVPELNANNISTMSGAHRK